MNTPSRAHVQGGGTPVLRAERLALLHPGAVVFTELSFAVYPGLTLIRGGDGRGKTGLLQMMAGVLAPSGGVLHRSAQTVYWVDPDAASSSTQTASQWLQDRRAVGSRWDERMARRCIEGLALNAHLEKSLFMLSTGTRRKLWLTAALAGNAELVLLDMPYAALDAASCRALNALLTEKAAQALQAWVIADYTLPEGLSQAVLAGVVDLGE
jgi:ABC-type transport system involved in cytochrome c biogenesis ATPase subunit